MILPMRPGFNHVELDMPAQGIKRLAT